MVSDLEQYILSNKPTAEFRPRPLYSATGDFVSFLATREDHYARRVDEFLTTYHSMKSHKVIGCKIKGVRHVILKTLEKYGMSLRGLRLNVLSLAGRGLAKEPSKPEDYEDVWEITRDVPLNDDVFECCGQG